MSEGEISSLSRLIPTLTGTESFVAWRRAINAYLLDKGSLRVLEGREKEPFRREIDSTVPGDSLVVRPVGDYAGADMPTDAQRDGTVTAYTAAQRTRWDDWERKERKARSTIILTVSAGIASEIETMWSAAEMYSHICAEHKIDTFERRGNITWRILNLRLPSGATAEQMNSHYEQFATLISESAAAGSPLSEWDKTERFLLGLGDDMDPLRFQYRLMPEAQRSWRNIVMIYKSFADSRQMKVDRDAAVAGSVAAIFPNGTQPGNGGRNSRKPKPKGKGGKGGGKGDKGKSDKSTCSYCGYTGHKEVDCRKKKSGEPSKAEIMDAVKRIKEKKGGSVNHVNADGWLGSESLCGDTFHVSQTYPPLAAANRGAVEFLIDSGATHHLVNDRCLLSSIESVPKITFGLAGSGSLESTQKGRLDINLKDSPSLKVADVYYVPGVRLNILSVMKLRHNGWKIDFDAHALSHGSTTFRMTSSGLPRVTFGAPRRPTAVSPPLGVPSRFPKSTRLSTASTFDSVTSVERSSSNWRRVAIYATPSKIS